MRIPDVLSAAQATTERAKALVPFDLTERQARFLATVMLHSGLFVGRQYAAFAGITHGQKVHDFIERLLARRFVTPIELGSTGRTRIFSRSSQAAVRSHRRAGQPEPPSSHHRPDNRIWFLRQPQPMALDASVANHARLQALESQLVV